MVDSPPCTVRPHAPRRPELGKVEVENGQFTVYRGRDWLVVVDEMTETLHPVADHAKDAKVVEIVGVFLVLRDPGGRVALHDIRRGSLLHPAGSECQYGGSLGDVVIMFTGEDLSEQILYFTSESPPRVLRAGPGWRLAATSPEGGALLASAPEPGAYRLVTPGAPDRDLRGPGGGEILVLDKLCAPAACVVYVRGGETVAARYDLPGGRVSGPPVALCPTEWCRGAVCSYYEGGVLFPGLEPHWHPGLRGCRIDRERGFVVVDPEAGGGRPDRPLACARGREARACWYATGDVVIRAPRLARPVCLRAGDCGIPFPGGRFDPLVAAKVVGSTVLLGNVTEPKVVWKRVELALNGPF